MLSAALMLTLALGGAGKKDRVIEVDCRKSHPSRCTAGMYAKEKAPFDGVLMTGDLAAYLYLTEKNEQKRIDLAVKKATELKDLEIQHQKDLREIDKEAFEEKLQIKDEAHAQQLELVRRPWYEHPAFIIPVTVAATIGVVMVTKEVIEATK